METYSLRGVGAETARAVARTVSEAFDVERVRVRGLAEAVRASGYEGMILEGETGYFEDEVGGDELESVVDSLPSFTRVVFYAGRPVFAWFKDGKLYLRADDGLLNSLSERGVEPNEAARAPESVVAEMSDED